MADKKKSTGKTTGKTTGGKQRVSTTPPPKKTSGKGKPVGVAEDYGVGGLSGRGSAASGMGISITDLPRAPLYYDSDLDAPINWDPVSRIVPMQRDLVAAGLLSEKGLRLGVYDDKTRNAYKKLLTYANQAGMDRTHAFQALLEGFTRGQALGGGAKRAPFVAELPSPDDVRKVAEKIAPTIRGRNLDVAEVDAIIREYNALATKAQRAAYDAAPAGGTVTDAPDVSTYIENRTKELHPEEADTFDRFQLGNEAMRILGLTGQVRER